MIMQNSIDQHTNPMTAKKPFIKKKRQSNLFINEKTNLSMTNATRRLSLDKTSTYTSYPQDSLIKNPHHQYLQFTQPQISSKSKRPFSTRLSLGKENQKPYQTKDIKQQRQTGHKQKLRSILHTIDMNNSMIQELFQFQEDISFFKKQIAKTLYLHNNLNTQLKNEINQKQKNKKFRLIPIKIQERLQEMECEQFSKRIEQLQNKKKMVGRQKEWRKGISLLSTSLNSSMV